MIKYPLNVIIDSNIFYSNKFDLADDSKLFKLIRYVEKKKIKVILSNIVVGEILKHIQDKAYEIVANVNNLRRELNKNYSESLIKNLNMEYYLTKVNRNDMGERARNILKNFLTKLDAEILNNSDVDTEKIFNDYFKIKPPFEDNIRKRKEFPDAFIVEQIRARFKKNEKLVIVSQDRGFKKACNENLSNFDFYESLGDLYEKLTKKEEEYNACKECINSLNDSICDEIKNIISDTDCVDVIGITFDNDGIQDGYDYSEILVENVSDVLSEIHTIDEISEEHVYATLKCSAHIYVSCFYEDYDNAIWDSENKSYLYLETKENIEIHTARFGVQVEINKKSNDFKLSKFRVRLGDDSRECRQENIEEDNYDDYDDYEQDIMDMDRESFGLRGMGEYDRYLEEELANSEMKEKFVNKFEEINDLLDKFEDICNVYYEIMEKTRELSDEAKNIVLEVAKNMKNREDFPISTELSEIMDNDVEKFYKWIERRYLDIEKFYDSEKLPDCIEFGSQINFLDKYTLSIDELQINCIQGEETCIDMCFLNNLSNEEYKGYVNLTIGYINTDEEGGIEDGAEDKVEYDYDKILKEIDNVIENLEKILENHNELSEILEKFI